MLILLAVAAIIMSSVTVAAARDALRKAQRKLYLYTWQIRQLIPSVLSAPRGSGSTSPPSASS